MNRKVLLITGASSAVGIELIQRVYKDYDVIIAHYCHLNKDLTNLQETLGDKLVLMQADFLDKNSLMDMIRQIKEKGLVPNYIVHLPALKIRVEKFHKVNVERFQEEYTIAVQSIVVICQSFITQMIKNGGGNIVFMLSASVNDTPPKFMAYYITCKHALLGLMRALAAEYASKQIRVNAISPEMMETKFLNEIPELIIQQNAQKNPTGKNIAIREVIPMIEFLLSDEAARITGQNIKITGGMC